MSDEPSKQRGRADTSTPRGLIPEHKLHRIIAAVMVWDASFPSASQDNHVEHAIRAVHFVRAHRKYVPHPSLPTALSIGIKYGRQHRLLHRAMLQIVRDDLCISPEFGVWKLGEPPPDWVQSLRARQERLQQKYLEATRRTDMKGHNMAFWIGLGSGFGMILVAVLATWLLSGW